MNYIILAAIGLALIIEGFLPFAAPNLWRRFVLKMARQPNRNLQITGLFCMLLGLLLIYTAHHLIA